jgi:hypothetical protein
VFPFLARGLSARLVTPNVVANLASDTGSATGHSITGLLPFVFLSAAHKNKAGFWDFFGPTVLALAPLLLLAFKNTRVWRIPILIWFIASAGISFTFGLPRFLLPIFPLALAGAALGLRKQFAEGGRWSAPHLRRWWC